MKSLLVLSLLACAAPPATPPELPGPADYHPAAPTAEHTWLMQGVGEWESVGYMEAGGDAPMEMRSTETVRAIGDYWTVHEGTADVFGTPFTAILTIGYDPEAKHFVGTWIDSSSSMLWHYAGQLDAAGKALTLDTEGPLPWEPSRHGKFREVTEYTGPDTKVFTSSVQQEDGSWMQIVRVESKRKGT